MNSLMNFWLNRNRREQNLLLLMVLVSFFGSLIFVGATIFDETNKSRSRLQKAKQDYEYVQQGTERLVRLSKSQSLKNEPNTIINIIQGVSSDIGIEKISITFENDMVYSTFEASDIDQIIKFIDGVNNLTGFDPRSFEYKSIEGTDPVVIIFRVTT
tara:strand:+ start:386 stop:856 length:471 start_codon:yes stop_codon:yes gene_type:complete